MKKKNGARVKIREAGNLNKLLTGIDGFEHVSHGGIPENRMTLVAGTSGSGKTIFALEFLWRGITEFGQNGVFITCEENSRDVTKNAGSFGWDLDAQVKKGKLALIDASPLPESDYSGACDLGGFTLRIENAVKKVRAKRVVIDSASAFFSRFEDARMIRSELYQLAERLKAKGITVILTAERTEEYGAVARYGIEDFVSDNVIILRNVLAEGKRQRTLEILKLRGTTHYKGENPFTITREGIRVLAVSSIDLDYTSSSKRISTGNKEIDRMSGGGLFRDSIVLVNGATGTGKTLLAISLCAEGCRRGERIIFFGYEESRDQIIRNAASWGFDLEAWEKKGLLKILCSYPQTSGIEDHLLKMKKDILQFKPARVVIDSLTALENECSEKTFRIYVMGITSYLRAINTTGFFTSTTPLLTGNASITESQISVCTDTIFLLRYAEDESEMKRVFNIIKMRGSWHEKGIYEYEIDTKGLHIKEKIAAAHLT